MAEPVRHAEPLHDRHPVSALASNPANMRFARHRELLARWPVTEERWARAVEAARLAAIDHTPGPATFGR